MFTLIFFILFIAIFGRLLRFALRATWSMVKIMLFLVIIPAVLIGFIFDGLIAMALPLLIIFGLFSLLQTA